MAAALVLSGCKQTSVSEDYGQLVLKTLTAESDLNDKVINQDNASTKALPSELVNVNEFDVTIASTLEGGYSRTSKFSEISGQAIELPTGSFTITAKSPETATAAWDQPIFEGEKEFSIVGGAITPVEVKCVLANAMVSVKCSDVFLSELSEFNIKVSGKDGNFLVWNKENLAKDGYFQTTELTVTIDGKRSLDGSDVTLSGSIKNVSAKDHIILNVDAKVTGEVSNITLNIDGSVNDREENFLVDGFEEIEITDPDPRPDPDPDPVKPAAPSLEWPANPTFAAMELAETMDIQLTVKAPGKIKTFVVAVDSPSLDSILPSMTTAGDTNLDLINDAKFVSAASQLGLKSGDELKGQTEVAFDLSQLVPMIYQLNPPADSDHKFTLNISDESDQSYSKTLIFHYTGK